MIVTSYKTHKITPGEDLLAILNTYLPKLHEKTIVVITSKIISLCQKNIIKNDGTIDKVNLIKQEADEYYIDDNLMQRFGVLIPTIMQNRLIANAGIDESNADGFFILWPKNVQKTAEKVWMYLKKKHRIKKLGIIITDSRLAPLVWGIQGVGIAWCGFYPLQSYIGKPDIFGKPLRMSQKGILDGLATAAVVVMGEGNEQTPLSIISEVPFVPFQNRIPRKEEIVKLSITKQEDIYGKLLTSVPWEKGQKAGASKR